jgi:hypothetical protein
MKKEGTDTTSYPATFQKTRRSKTYKSRGPHNFDAVTSVFEQNMSNILTKYKRKPNLFVFFIIFEE